MRKSLMFSVTCWLVRAGLGIGVAMGAAVPASADMVTDWNATTAKTVAPLTPAPIADLPRGNRACGHLRRGQCD